MNSVVKDESNEEYLRKIVKDFNDETISKGKDMVFDKVYFLKKQKILVKNINEL